MLVQNQIYNIMYKENVKNLHIKHSILLNTIKVNISNLINKCKLNKIKKIIDYIKNTVIIFAER